MQFFIPCNFFCQKYKFTYYLLSGRDKSNTHYKYTIDEALQVALEFDDDSNYSDLSDEASTYSKVSIQRLQPTTTCFCS